MAGNELADRVIKLRAEAEEAEARYDHERAVARYTAALELPDLASEERFELLDGRATVFHTWGYLVPFSEDVKMLIELSRRMGDKRRLGKTLAVHGYNLAVGGPEDPTESFAEEAVDLARELEDVGLESLATMVLSLAVFDSDNERARQVLGPSSLALARRSEDAKILINVLCENIVDAYSSSDFERGQELASEARALTTGVTEPYLQVRVLIASGLAETDLAASRSYFEQAFTEARDADFLFLLVDVSYLLAILMWQLGLYNQSQIYALKAAKTAEQLVLPIQVGRALFRLGQAYFGKGLMDDAKSTFLEGIKRLPEKNSFFRSFHVLGLAQVALARGEHAEAIDVFQEAADAFKTHELVADASQGAAYLALGDFEKGLRHTRRAVESLDDGVIISYHQTQELWWHHYQVLKALQMDESFSALIQALEVMLGRITTLSDEGLRRNYLNKVAVNRDIIIEWATAAQRDVPLDNFTNHKPLTGNLHEQFRRVVDVGARLSAQHDVGALEDFIVEEFVEMSGAERVLLLRVEAGRSVVSVSYNPGDALELAEPLLETIRKSRRALRREDVGQVEEGTAAVLSQRSIVALPLIAQNRLLGILYGDMRQIFGRFDDGDLRLLSMLANQAAAALDNADLVTTLEERVEERTADLEARNNELAIINSVQEGLVVELDLQAIFELAGERLYEISQAQMVAICTFNYELNTVRTWFLMERGRRYEQAVRDIGEGHRDFIRNPRPDYMRTLDEIIDRFGPEIVTRVIEGTEISQSILYIPMIVGNEVLGYIDLQDERPHAFSESDIHLLTTLARSMSVALENARLFQDAKEARAMAEEANESKSRFLASMSHELRTPLNAIIGFTRIVQRKTKGTIPKKQTDNLGKVKDSAEHLLGLINTILDLAKIEAGRIDVINKPFEVEPLVRLCTAVTKPMLKPGVDVQMELAPDLPTVVSDQDKVKQILLNLLSNAAKFTHKGEIVASGELRVASGERLEGKHLRLSVTDSGIGMNEEQLGRVFEEFQQAEEITSKQYGGTGLGLPISKQLAELLGGALIAESKSGRGSTFTLILPVEPIA